MTPNKQVVHAYTEAFIGSDHAAVLACLTEDVVWTVPGAFVARGKAEFDAQIEHPDFRPHPAITVSRMTEENDVVIAEGTVRTERKDGTVLHLVFCDVFEMEGGRIRALTSYLMQAGA